jgi:uncharacterized protein YidB (DUF937 family)
MSLFDAITSAIANPNQQGSGDQLSNIMNTVSAITGSQSGGANSTALMSAVGSVVQSALQNHQAQIGSEGVENLVNQHAGDSPNPGAVQAIFGGQEQQAVEAIAQRTGMDANQISAVLPMVLPLVLNLLQSGAQTGSNSGGNPVLNIFLDGDHDGDVDLGDIFAKAGSFLGH